MRRGWPLLAIVSLLLVGLHPFTYTSLSTSFDGLLHLYRLVELDHLMSQGVFFPRWAPDFVFGFGYPIFNFYAPLAYYLSAPLHWLGFSFVDSATLFFVVCTVLASLAMFALTKNIFADTHAGFIAALAYVYAPAHIYDNFYRSAWGTVLAYAIIPLSLWALLNWYRTARAHYLWLLGVSVAALMLAHNISALLALPVIVGSAIVCALNSRQKELTRKRVLLNVPSTALCLLAIGFGLALSAFFWLPALVETPYIQTWRLTIPPDFDFHTHFLSVADWIAWPAPAEVGRINPELVNTLGPVHVLLATGGIVLTLGKFIFRKQTVSDEQSFVISADCPANDTVLTTYFALILLAALYMTLPQSVWLWENIPLLPSLQFPHRFLELASLCAAILSAALIAVLPTRWRAVASFMLCAMLIICAIPFLYPRPLPAVNPNPSLGDVLAYEHKTGALGTTASGEYFPIAVQFIPKSSTFEEAIVNGENPQRFDSHSLPAGAKVLAQQTSALSFALRIDSAGAYRATFRQFYFPGWQGYVDGQPVATAPNTGQGFSTFAVPAGEHQIALTLTATPVRDAGTLISLASAGLGFILISGQLVRAWRNRKMKVPDRTQGQQAPSRAFNPSSYFVLGLALFSFKVGIADQFDTPLRHVFDGERVPTVQYARSIGLGNTISWLGYDLVGDTTIGQSLDITLYWQAQRELDTVYSSFAHVIDEQANLYAQKDNLHPGGAPTTTWRPHEYDVDRHHIEIPAGTPPGEYYLEIGMYDPHTGARLQRENAKPGEPLDRILLGPFRIRAPVQPVSVAALRMTQPLTQTWPSGLSLLGFSTERERLPADDFFRVALFWRAPQPDSGSRLPSIGMSLRLIDRQGNTISSQRGEPSNNRFPTTSWRSGEIVRDNRALWIARTLPDGTYRLQLKLDSDEQWLELTEISKP